MSLDCTGAEVKFFLPLVVYAGVCSDVVAWSFVHGIAKKAPGGGISAFP